MCSGWFGVRWHVPPSFKRRRPDDARTSQPGVCSGATRSLGFNHIFTSPVLSTLLRVMALVARRRNSDARGLRACRPSAKGGVASLRVSRREALISRLVRPVILYGIGRSRRQQRRKRRHCRSRNDDFSHDLSPSSLSDVPAPGCLSITWLQGIVYFCTYKSIGNLCIGNRRFMNVNLCL